MNSTLPLSTTTSDRPEHALVEGKNAARLSGDIRRAGFMVPDAAAVLKRFHFVLRECVRLQAGWMPGTEHWETKLALPEFLWQDELAAWQLRERILELRYPERRIEPSGDSSCIAFWRALGNAPSDRAFATAFFGVAKPVLQAALSDYLRCTDHLDDAPTVRILHHTVSDLGSQISRSGTVHWDRLSLQEEKWLEIVQRAFEELGGTWWNPAREADFETARDTLTSEGQAFSIARRGKRDPRFARALFSWPDSLDPSRGAGEGFELQVRQAQAHLNEVWAAEMAAACIYDLMDAAPPAFLHDAARWCFDEIRHCRMGYTRLLEWGFAENEMPMGSYSYDLGEHLDPLTRLGVIFYFETTYIHTKSERSRSFAAFGDRTSSHDMDFDWADELIHTHYGKKWLGKLLEAEGSGRTIHEVKDAALLAVDHIRASATPLDRSETERLYVQTMARARELAAHQASRAEVVE